MAESKTHYRKVFKSDHLGVADLEEMSEEGMKKFIFTIKEVKQYLIDPNIQGSGIVVAGKRISANIAKFTDPKIKDWVLNSTNAKQVSKFAKSPFTEDWNNIVLELFIDSNVKMKGALTNGIRVKPLQPKPKVKKAFTEVDFEKANKNNATIEAIKKYYTMTKEVEESYTEYVLERVETTED